MNKYCLWAVIGPLKHNLVDKDIRRRANACSDICRWLLVIKEMVNTTPEVSNSSVMPFLSSSSVPRTVVVNIVPKYTHVISQAFLI